MIFNKFFRFPMWVLTYLICYTSSSLNINFTTVKKNFPVWSLSVTGLWVYLLIHHLEFIFLFTIFVPIDLPTLTTQFYTLLVRYFTLVLYFTIYLYAIQPVSYTFQCRLCPVLLCYCASSFSNVFSFYTCTYFLWHAITILMTSWPALHFLSSYVILLIVSCYWYATCFVVENIALKKLTWIGGQNVGW